jgi:tellurite resistance protein TerC
MEINIWFWVGFNLFVLFMLALDLWVFHKKSEEVSVREALTWSGIWISLALVFNGLIYKWFGQDKAIEFLTGYVIEKSLSVDNIFVFTIIFSYFAIPKAYQHKVLFWWVLGAIFFRIIFIFAGVSLLENFHFIIYIFGAILLYTAWKLISWGEMKVDPEKSYVIKLVSRIIPFKKELHGDKFFTRENAKLYGTPLFMCLIFIETADLVFAVDSIPAILAITQDKFIVYTSNVFAIMGLRSLYFALAGVIDRFRYLPIGLAFILAFVGTKMLIIDIYKIPVHYSLIVILTILVMSVSFSLYKTKEECPSSK